MMAKQLSSGEQQAFSGMLKDYGWRWHPGGYWVHPNSPGVYTLEAALKRLGRDTKAKVLIDNLGVAGVEGDLEEFAVGLWMLEEGEGEEGRGEGEGGELQLSDHFTQPGFHAKDAERHAAWLAEWLGVAWAYNDDKPSEGGVNGR